MNAETTSESESPEVTSAEAPVYVWQLPVRIAHWTIFFCIIVLSITGYYIYRPFISPETTSTGVFLMAKIRFLHEVTAFIFTVAVLLRLYWGFVGNRYARWAAFLPIHKDQWARFKQTLRYYFFVSRKPPRELGHNPLAAIAYLIIYTLFILQILTGFALYAWVYHVGPWTSLFGWLTDWIPVQQIRLVHFLIMWAFLAFTIHHVYSSVIWDSEERNGLLSSMITGFKRRVLGPVPGESKATLGYWIERVRHRGTPPAPPVDSGQAKV